MKTKRTAKSVGREKGFKWAYKVVLPKLTPLTYKSCWIYGKYAVTYKIGEETVAPVGGLLVFGDLKRARSWSLGMFGGAGIVLKVRAYDPVPLYRAANTYAFGYEKRDMEKFWKPGTRSRHVAILGYNWPEGTLAFRRIIPTKEMK